MNKKQFAKLISDLQPISLPFYLDDYSSTNYDLNNYCLKSGDFAIELFGHCNYNNRLSSFNINITVWDKDNQALEFTPQQYKTLKINVINNIVTNGTEHSAAI